MWTFLKSGFYSAVEDRDDPELLLVRCRTLADMTATGWPYQETPDADYRYRARVTKADYADFVARAVMDISYPSFKDAVAEEEPDRADTYTRIWWLLRGLQETADASEAIPDEYQVMAAQWDVGGEKYGQPYGEIHELAEGEPEFDPLHPSAAWLEFRYYTHWDNGPTSSWPERPWKRGMGDRP